VAGAYDVTTQFNLLDALPPDVKEALGMAIEFADSPGNFLLDMADRLPVIKYVVDALNLFTGIRDKVVMAIDEYINGWSGGMVTTMHNLAQDVEMALRGLKAHNHLVVGTPAGGAVTVQDTLSDLTFTYAGVDYPYAQNANATANGTVTGLQLKLGGHAYDHGLRIGAILVDLVDNVALPQLTGELGGRALEPVGRLRRRGLVGVELHRQHLHRAAVHLQLHQRRRHRQAVREHPRRRGQDAGEQARFTGRARQPVGVRCQHAPCRAAWLVGPRRHGDGRPVVAVGSHRRGDHHAAGGLLRRRRLIARGPTPISA
jgi:hypothetical protein